VQVIHQRSAFGTFSISYNGARTMANVEPAALSVPTNAFISSPRLPGILGLGALGDPIAQQRGNDRGRVKGSSEACSPRRRKR